MSNRDIVTTAARIAQGTCGGLAAALGAAGMAFALFSNSMVTVSYAVITTGVPICTPTPCPQVPIKTIPTQTVTHSSIAASQGVTGTLEVFVLGVGLVLIAIALGAIMHGITTSTRWLPVLWISTGLLLLATLLTGFSIGFAFLPADAFAIAASALGLARLLEPPRPATLPDQ
jgi:hypothetical protein